MAWKTLQFKLTSSAPLLMHNGRLANPLDKFAKSLKQISSKKAKTDADHEEMGHIEFLASLYMGPDGPVLPSDLVDAVVINGARKSKEGPFAKSGCYCAKNAKLEYQGPKTADELWENNDFRFVSMVRVGQNRVVRTRPVFKEWTAIIDLNVEDTLVNPARVFDWLVDAGTQIGIGDWRPQYGRFTVEKVN